MFRVLSPTTWNSESHTTKLYCLFFEKNSSGVAKRKSRFFLMKNHNCTKFPLFLLSIFPPLFPLPSSPFHFLCPLPFSSSPFTSFPSVSPSPSRFPFSHLPPFLSLPKIQPEGLGKRCWLSQPGPERSPGRRMHFKLGYRC